MFGLTEIQQMNSKAAVAKDKLKKPQTRPVFATVGLSPVAQLADGFEKAKKEREEFAKKYPQHAKFQSRRKDADVLGAFLTMVNHADPKFIKKLMAMPEKAIVAWFLDIDVRAFDAEKDAMLEEVRKQNA